MRRAASIALAFSLFALSGCATPPTDPAARAEFTATNDPFEPLNRKIFAFNQYFDDYLLKPTAEGYRKVVPEHARNALRHFFDNLGQPVIFANNILQGQFKIADETAGRFLLNSTFGLGGTIDLATGAGLPAQTGDFGQTLYSWGVPSGPYIVLPVLGPSDPRDAIGMGVDGYADPFGWLAGYYNEDAANYARYVVSGIDLRSRNIESIDELQHNAIDYYAELRSLYRQHRASELRHGAPPPVPTLLNGSELDPAERMMLEAEETTPATPVAANPDQAGDLPVSR